MATPDWLASRSTVWLETSKDKELIRNEWEEWDPLSFTCYHDKSVLFTCHVMISPSPRREFGAAFTQVGERPLALTLSRAGELPLPPTCSTVGLSNHSVLQRGAPKEQPVVVEKPCLASGNSPP